MNNLFHLTDYIIYFIRSGYHLLRKPIKKKTFVFYDSFRSRATERWLFSYMQEASEYGKNCAHYLVFVVSEPLQESLMKIQRISLCTA